MTPELFDANYTPESQEKKKNQELLDAINSKAKLIGKAIERLEPKTVLSKLMLASVFAPLGDAMRMCEEGLQENQDNAEIKAKLRELHEFERAMRLNTAVDREYLERNYNTMKETLGIQEEEKELVEA